MRREVRCFGAAISDTTFPFPDRLPRLSPGVIPGWVFCSLPIPVMRQLLDIVHQTIELPLPVLARHVQALVRLVTSKSKRIRHSPRLDINQVPRFVEGPE